MPGLLTDSDTAEAEALVENFYDLLPLFLSLFSESPVTPNLGLDPLLGLASPPQLLLDKDKALRLLRLRKRGMHLSVDNMIDLNPDGRSPILNRITNS